MVKRFLLAAGLTLALAACQEPNLASSNRHLQPIPPQTVDRTGEISVPYVGRVRVLGRLTGEVESDIRESLRLKTADPQVVVNISQRQGGDLISVTGDVKSAARIPVSLAGTSLVDSIAAAGGAQSAPYDTMVTVTRGDSTRSDTLQEIYDKPAKNISLQPGDTIVLRKRALNFLAFGATGRVGSFPITVEDLRLSDAVAASGGPADLEANPATIFVYRLEPASLLREIGRTNLAGDGLTTPVVYQLDLHNPKGFFYANNFTVRDRDLVYYAPAGSAGVVKFMRLVNTLLAPAIGGAGAASSATILASP
jgi:polysaccharide export outer membrane protein